MRYEASLVACLVTTTIRGVTLPGSLDPAFDAGTLGATLAISVQQDGKIVIGGHFAKVNATPMGHVARLEANGALDSTFNTGSGADGFVRTLQIQQDGSILLGGNFINVNGVPCGGIARLKSDGSLDRRFETGTGANDQVTALAIQMDGKILVGGYFTEFAGMPRNYLARLNPDGSLDAGFNPGDVAGDNVYAMGLQADRKILVAGYFIWNQRIFSLVRLNADGSLDESFVADALVSEINALCLQTDGKILVGGSGHYNLNTGRREHCIDRLNSDGSLDVTFNAGAGPDDYVECVAVQANGKILIGGNFTRVGEAPRRFIARLNGDGSVESGFDTGSIFNQWVSCIVLQNDGRILVGGNSSKSGGAARDSVARLAGDPVAPSSPVRLSIHNLRDRKALLSWTVAAKDFVLETRESLTGAGSWRPAAGAVAVDSQACWWTNETIPANAYFRLRQP